jgi:hypothetical protein
MSFKGIEIQSGRTRALLSCFDLFNGRLRITLLLHKPLSACLIYFDEIDANA